MPCFRYNTDHSACQWEKLLKCENERYSTSQSDWWSGNFHWQNKHFTDCGPPLMSNTSLDDLNA